MNNKSPNFSKAAQQKPRRAKKLETGANAQEASFKPSENIILKHLNIGVNWFDGRDGPEPWIWASAFTLHLFLAAIFISIPPMDFKERQIFGVEIINEIEPPLVEKPPEPIIEPEVEKPAPAPIEKPLQQTIIEAEPTPEVPANVQISPPEEVQKLELIKPKNIIAKTEINKKIAPVPKIAPIEEIKTTQTIEDEEPIEEIKAPAPINLEPVQKLNLKTNVRIEPKNLNNASPINLGARRLENKNSAIPNLNPNLNIDTAKLEREAEQREAEQLAREQATREKTAREQAAKLSQSKAANNSNTSPIAKNGELAPPSSAGVTAIAPNAAASNGNSGPVGSAANSAPVGGANSQNANNSGAGGPLPRGPRIVGNGRNVFESNENNSLLARMARTADCSTIGRERDEKCPNWAPLEKASRPIPAPIPKDVKQRLPTGIDPLPPCPLGTPQSNMGISCLPSKSAPNGRTQ